MRLKLQFGLSHGSREAVWWQPIELFPPLVRYRGTKWEFAMYGQDKGGGFDYICHFSEVMTYDPNWHATTYEDVERYLVLELLPDCHCGAKHTSFPKFHMFMCPLWKPWSQI